jgi:thiol-disulfide isomerase/thioredoxin
MKYLVLLTVVSFASVCGLIAFAGLDRVKQDLSIADWSGVSESDDPGATVGRPGAEFSGSAGEAPKLVLMKFGADWCPPCRMVEKELKVLERSRLPLTIRKIDIDNRPDLARQYNVSGIPRLILLEDGREVGDLTGFRSADQLTDWITDAASPAALAAKKRSGRPAVVKANPFVQ